MDANLGTERANEAHRIVGAVWCNALGLPDFDGDDDFFALGGHSLLVVEVVEEIQRLTGVSIPLAFFFAHPRIDKLADYVVARG